jgi:hypothetical protein
MDSELFCISNPLKEKGRALPKLDSAVDFGADMRKLKCSYSTEHSHENRIRSQAAGQRPLLRSLHGESQTRRQGPTDTVQSRQVGEEVDDTGRGKIRPMGEAQGLVRDEAGLAGLSVSRPQRQSVLGRSQDELQAAIATTSQVLRLARTILHTSNPRMGSGIAKPYVEVVSREGYL